MLLPLLFLTLGMEPLSVTHSGRLDVILDWTFATSPIGLYIVQAECTVAQFNARSCNFLARSEDFSKPRKISLAVSPGNYDMLVANFAHVDESLSTQVFLRSTTCPALAASGAGAASVPASGADLVRKLTRVLNR